MNPNSTQTKRNLKDEADERFVARYLEKQGMKAVQRDAVMLNLRSHAHLIRELMECARTGGLQVGYGTDLDELADMLIDQIAAQTKPAEPQGLGAVVEDTEGRLWVRVCGTTIARSWQDNDRGANERYHEIDVVRVHTNGWEPKP